VGDIDDGCLPEMLFFLILQVHTTFQTVIVISENKKAEPFLTLPYLTVFALTNF
jgi:hypothetical protein